MVNFFDRRMARWILVLGTLVWLSVRGQGLAQEGVTDPLADQLRPFTDCVASSEPFCLNVSYDRSADDRLMKVDIELVRYDAASFDLSVTHSDYAVSLRRSADATALALPKHKVVYHGVGAVDDNDHLTPHGIIARLITPRTSVSMYVPLLMQADPKIVSLMLQGFMQVQYDPVAKHWKIGDKSTIEFPALGTMTLATDNERLTVRVSRDIPSQAAVNAWPGMRVVELERSEIERQLTRGARRALEILAPGTSLIVPEQKTRRVPHGELRWVDGHRVALLKGTPEEVGKAHGELLRDESLACIDSVLYAFGTAQTISSGRWFREDLATAYTRLKPHIPERHLAETRALANALQLDPALVEAVNVFPEMFHCSGFALFGKATRDGKLYHGRVLDYMTEIGLQDAATTFVVSVDGQIPFANVGYAGFIGSVSGMNVESISLGEMGGKGEGHWDGVPMATLMRRALEECHTLDDVMTLWRDSPRTCEYYYVFADGKTNRAVGVAAVPESVEFIQPGQSHDRLGEGIADAVVLSAGNRLQTLRERVQEKYGQFDVDLGQWLMSRPVAMTSNLHNVLFVPADGVLYVANADHAHCAAERPYIRVDVKKLVDEMSESAR